MSKTRVPKKLNKAKKKEFITVRGIKIWPELKSGILYKGRGGHSTLIQCPVCLNTHVCNAVYPNWGHNITQEDIDGNKYPTHLVGTVPRDFRAGCVGNKFLFHYENPNLGFDVGIMNSPNDKHELTSMICRIQVHQWKSLDKIKDITDGGD